MSHAHCGCGVKATEFLGKGLRKGGTSFEVYELVRVLQESDDSEIDHIDHGFISGNEHEEGNLDGVQLFDMSRHDLLNDEPLMRSFLSLRMSFPTRFADIIQELVV